MNKMLTALKNVIRFINGYIIRLILEIAYSFIVLFGRKSGLFGRVFVLLVYSVIIWMALNKPKLCITVLAVLALILLFDMLIPTGRKEHKSSVLYKTNKRNRKKKRVDFFKGLTPNEAKTEYEALMSLYCNNKRRGNLELIEKIAIEYSEFCRELRVRE